MEDFPPSYDKDAYRIRRKRKRRLYRLRQRAIEIGSLLLVIVVIAVCVTQCRSCGKGEPVLSEPPVAEETVAPVVRAYPSVTDETVVFGGDVDAQNAILVDVTENKVLARRDENTVRYPASITKVMTLLTAVEHITDFTATYTMGFELLNDLYIQEASMAGFSTGEAVSMEDLLYGLILPSGADAAGGLAEAVAGSEEAFVSLMNEKVAQLGLKNTHFANTSGLHDEQNYTTCTDMALIMIAAMENEHCRKVLSTYQYTTAPTEQHPDGILLTSTMFSRMYGDEPDGATIIAGKTGYVVESKHTMVSYAVGDDGHEYVLVTMMGSNRWKAIYDAINIYSAFCRQEEEISSAESQ